MTSLGPEKKIQETISFFPFRKNEAKIRIFRTSNGPSSVSGCYQKNKINWRKPPDFLGGLID